MVKTESGNQLLRQKWVGWDAWGDLQQTKEVAGSDNTREEAEGLARKYGYPYVARTVFLCDDSVGAIVPVDVKIYDVKTGRLVEHRTHEPTEDDFRPPEGPPIKPVVGFVPHEPFGKKRKAKAVRLGLKQWKTRQLEATPPVGGTVN